MIPIPPAIPIPSVQLPRLANVSIPLGGIPSVTHQQLQPIPRPTQLVTPTPPGIGGEITPSIQTPVFDFIAYSAEIFEYLDRYLGYLSDIEDYLLQKEALCRKYAKEKLDILNRSSSKGMFYMPGADQYLLYWTQGDERRDLIELFYKAMIQRIDKVLEIGDFLTEIYTEYYQMYLQNQLLDISTRTAEMSLSTDLALERISLTVDMWADYIDQVIKDLDSVADWNETVADNTVLNSRMEAEVIKASTLDVKKDLLLISKSSAESKSIFNQSTLPVLSAQISALVGEEKRTAAMIYEATARATRAAAAATTSLWQAAKEKADINVDKLLAFREHLQVAKEQITAERLYASSELTKSYGTYLQSKAQLDSASETLSVLKDQMKTFVEQGRALLEKYDAMIEKVVVNAKQRAIRVNLDNIEKFGDAQEVSRNKEFQTLSEITDRLKSFMAELEMVETRDAANIRAGVALAIATIEANMRVSTKIIHTLGA